MISRHDSILRDRRLARYAVAAIAASLVLALSFMFGFGPQGEMLYATAPGETRLIALDDGSTVELGGGSRLAVLGDRAARLDDGQALVPRRSVHLDIVFTPLPSQPWSTLEARHVARLKSDARSIAVPTADIDANVREKQLLHWLDMGMTILNVAAFFIPVLNPLMLTLGAAQIMGSVFQGISAWEDGDNAEAIAHYNARIEREGALVDAALLKIQSGELGDKMDTLEREAIELAGEPFNLGSPRQLGAILYDKFGLPVLKKTPKGQPSTAEEALEALAEEGFPLDRREHPRHDAFDVVDQVLDDRVVADFHDVTLGQGPRPAR